jgi:hypothetical protein
VAQFQSRKNLTISDRQKRNRRIDSVHERVEPTNDHERVIAGIVDQFYAEGSLSVAAGAKIADAVGFVMSPGDWKFLVQYTHWRMANPIPK